MDPRTRFFRFAFACAGWLRDEGRISVADFETLEALADTPRTVPRTDFLARCFPIAAENLSNLAKETGREDPWSDANVSDFWENRHLEHRTPVEIFVVDYVRGDGFVKIKGEGPKFFQNRYNLDLKPGDRIRTHSALVVEKID